jgi:hypothetical protein
VPHRRLGVTDIIMIAGTGGASSGKHTNTDSEVERAAGPKGGSSEIRCAPTPTARASRPGASRSRPTRNRSRDGHVTVVSRLPLVRYW